MSARQSTIDPGSRALFFTQKVFMRRDNVTKLLHALIALGISANLIISLFMVPAELGVKGDVPYLVHQWAGLSLFATVMVYWLWKLAGNLPQGWPYFFPWFSKATYPAIWLELRVLLRLQLREVPESGVLSGAIHGLGLLTASVMAASGTVQFLLLQRYFANSSVFDLSKATHEFFATFMWIYLIGHVLMAAMHQTLGHKSISTMFFSN